MGSYFHAYFRLETLALLYSLPFALLMWGFSRDVPSVVGWHRLSARGLFNRSSYVRSPVVLSAKPNFGFAENPERTLSTADLEPSICHNWSCIVKRLRWMVKYNKDRKYGMKKPVPSDSLQQVGPHQMPWHNGRQNQTQHTIVFEYIASYSS
ncbi:hypothetical protein B0H17DRAFT_1125765 [Mycena rosella]|uniref:Uncharacterized protein n=1 Tax=Mycena rosella TaxID=1033263 RepID=A0AAD7GWT4_MYCRO|nr:hypothetical protein B0H17DRAFT_1125765 [Mycena rosella]